MATRDEYGQVAGSVPFDNDNNSFVSDDVQGAIEELADTVSRSASPGFSFGRGSNISAGTFLNRTGNVPSNRTGVTFGLYNGNLDEINVGSENINTYDVTVWQHDGDFINPIEIATVSVVASRAESFVRDTDFTIVNLPVRGKQFAVEISSGSGRNIGVDLQLSGTNTP